MSVFADTSGLYAVVDRKDANHERAKTAWVDWLTKGETLLTNNYVVLETVSLLQDRMGLAAVRLFYEDFMPFSGSTGFRNNSISPAWRRCSSLHGGG